MPSFVVADSTGVPGGASTAMPAAFRGQQLHYHQPGKTKCLGIGTVLWLKTCMQTAADGCMQSLVHAVLHKQMTQHMITGGASL